MIYKFKFSERPIPFTCEHCNKDFSGIWKHYKCLGCINILVCQQCYHANKHPPHKVESCGPLFRGILFFLTLSGTFFNNYFVLFKKSPQRSLLKWHAK
jgi:hypothetical protein